jgi:hypothetical protein
MKVKMFPQMSRRNGDFRRCCMRRRLDVVELQGPVFGAAAYESQVLPGQVLARESHWRSSMPSSNLPPRRRGLLGRGKPRGLLVRASDSGCLTGVCRAPGRPTHPRPRNFQFALPLSFCRGWISYSLFSCQAGLEWRPDSGGQMTRIVFICAGGASHRRPISSSS